MRLFLVELTRFRSRRAIALLILAAVVLAALVTVKVAWDSRPLTEQDRVTAAAQAKLAAKRPALVEEIKACEAAPTDYLGPDAVASGCAPALGPNASDFYPRKALDLGLVLNHSGLYLAVVLVGLMVIAGCTFAGADWASRSVATQLLYETRRTRVWLAKAAAVMAGAAVVAVVVLGGFWAAMAVLADARGVSLSDVTTSHIGWHLVRAVVLVAAAALGGYALTMLFRNTVAALALLFVLSVGGELAMMLLPLNGAGRWGLGNNLFGWLATKQTYFDATLTCRIGNKCDGLATITHLEAGSYLAMLLLLAVLLSVVVFRRADV